jgi:Lar family restriction alleviation protein
MIKPCPFCGSLPLVATYSRMQGTVQGKSVSMYYRVCDTCNARGPEALSEAQATERWNKRYTLSEKK